MQRSEFRSQEAAAADTSQISPRREPQGQQLRVAAAIRVMPKLGLGPPTAPAENYDSRRASLRGGHLLRPTTPSSPRSRLQSPPRGPP